MPPETIKRMYEEERQWCLNQLHLAEPWTDDIKWKPLLVIKSETFKTRSLFKVKPLKFPNVNDADNDQLIISPCKRWCYCEKDIVRRGDHVQTAKGRARGKVIFDGPLIVPALHQADPYGVERWTVGPWMSITPQELLTLRPGTKRAKGTVIVAGLGLGHQLIEVSHRKQVKKIVLVEKDKSLVHWILPRIKPFMKNPVYPRFEVVIGDAYAVMPKMTADVALVDIFPSYGGNQIGRDRLRESCPKIGFIWAWGCGGYRD
jgi:hypothetical protein